MSEKEIKPADEIKAIELEAAKLDEEFKRLGEQRAAIDRQRQLIRDEFLRLDGIHRHLSGKKGGDKEKMPALEIPSKKKKK